MNLGRAGYRYGLGRRRGLVAAAGGLLAAVALLAAASPAPAAEISAGYHHTCAFTAAGAAKCWGANNYGQLGDGTTKNHSTPVGVSGLSSGVLAISAGHHHTCAVTGAGGAKCWGGNSYGQLGDGTLKDRHTPVDVSGLSSGVRQISAGDNHTCALTDAGGVKCWGFNQYGQLGNANISNRGTYPTPLDVTGLSSGVQAISAGNWHTCALTDAGGVKCWGNNSHGQLGDGTTKTESFTAVDVRGLSSGVQAISAGGSHTCALTDAGAAKCWGEDVYGALGDGATNTDRWSPVSVSGLSSGVQEIDAGGDNNTCAVTDAGKAKCWGANGHGQIGDGTTKNHSTPVDVSGLSSGVSDISAGYHHTCALTDAGGAKCWGGNSYAQLGDGTTKDRSTPVDVLGFGVAGAPPPLDTKITKARINSEKHKATFKFKGTGGVGELRFKCKVDQKKFKGCSSPKTYRHLREAEHTFKVKAIDSRGRADPTPAKREFELK